MSDDNVRCSRCGNPRLVNAYCAATEECRAYADAMQAQESAMLRARDERRRTPPEGVVTSCRVCGQR